jgi:hypothetical protein
MDLEDETPPKGRAEKARRWLTTCAVLISALTPLVIKAIDHFGR